MSLRGMVFQALARSNSLSNKQLYELFPEDNKTSIRVYANEQRKVNEALLYGDIPKIKRPPTKGLKPQPAPVSTGGGATNYYDMSIKSLLETFAKAEVIHAIQGQKTFNLNSAVNLLSNKEFLERAEIQDGVFWISDTRPYKRPSWLYPWQPLAIDLLMGKMGGLGCMYLGSRQRIGKTLSAAFAMHERCLASPGATITVVAPTRDLGDKLMRQMFKEVIHVKDPVTMEPTGQRVNLWHEIFEPYIVIDNVREKVYKNGSRIQLITLDYKAVQGIASDWVHIEELDKIVRLGKSGDVTDKLEALAGLLPQILAKGKYARITMTCNMASGLFRFLRDELYEFGIDFAVYQEIPNLTGEFTGAHEIYNEDVICPIKPTTEIMIKKIMACLMGEGYAMQQLSNVEDYTGEIWNPEMVAKAYNAGVVWEDPSMYESVWMGVDPGAGHPCAFTIWGRVGKKVVLLWCKGYTSANINIRDMVGEVTDMCIALKVSGIASESNSGAKWIIEDICTQVERKSRGMQRIQVKWSNFGSVRDMGAPESKVIPKSQFIRLMIYLFDLEWLVLRNRNDHERVLKKEIALYNPDRAALGQKFKGDSIEASMHGIWHMLGGKRIMKELQIKQSGERKYAY